MFARHKKLVYVARRLQVGKACNAAVYLGHPWAVGAQTLGPLRGIVFRWCPGLQLRGGVVLAGELVDGGMEDGAEGERITGEERANLHGI